MKMKKQYFTPVTDLVVINLKNSVLQSIDLGGESDVATGGAGANNDLVDFEEDSYDDAPTSKNLWD